MVPLEAAEFGRIRVLFAKAQLATGRGAAGRAVTLIAAGRGRAASGGTGGIMRVCTVP